MNLKTLASLTAAAVLSLTLAACTGQSPQQREANQQSQDQQSLEQSQPVPHYNWSQIRQTLIDAETISADSTQTTSFFFLMGARDPVFSCPSIGEPVANTASLTNPLQVDPNSNGAVIGQMDPNGIYTPAASQGTYVICVNASGAKYLQYWEGEVMTVAAEASWNAATHMLVVTGAPTAVVHTRRLRSVTLVAHRNRYVKRSPR